MSSSQIGNLGGVRWGYFISARVASFGAAGRLGARGLWSSLSHRSMASMLGGHKPLGWSSQEGLPGPLPLSLCGFSKGLPRQRGLGVPFLPAQDSQGVCREKDSSGRDWIVFYDLPQEFVTSLPLHSVQQSKSLRRGHNQRKGLRHPIGWRRVQELANIISHTMTKGTSTLLCLSSQGSAI